MTFQISGDKNISVFRNYDFLKKNPFLREMYTEIYTGKYLGFALKLMRMISRWRL